MKRLSQKWGRYLNRQLATHRKLYVSSGDLASPPSYLFVNTLKRFIIDSALRYVSTSIGLHALNQHFFKDLPFLFSLEAVTCHRALVESDDANHYSSLKTSDSNVGGLQRLCQNWSYIKKKYRTSRTMALYGDQEEKMRSIGGLAPCIVKDVMLVH